MVPLLLVRRFLNVNSCRKRVLGSMLAVALNVDVSRREKWLLVCFRYGDERGRCYGRACLRLWSVKIPRLANAARVVPMVPVIDSGITKMLGIASTPVVWEHSRWSSSPSYSAFIQ